MGGDGALVDPHHLPADAARAAAREAGAAELDQALVELGERRDAQARPDLGEASAVAAMAVWFPLLTTENADPGGTVVSFASSFPHTMSPSTAAASASAQAPAR